MKLLCQIFTVLFAEFYSSSHAELMELMELIAQLIHSKLEIE